MQKKILQLTIISFLIFPLYGWNVSSNLNNTTNFNSTKNAILLNNSDDFSYNTFVTSFYHKINDNDLSFEAFNYGLKGYLKLKKDDVLSNSKYLTIIDMSASSNVERFYLINMKTQTIEHKSLVAHGRNSGLEFASKFSNIKNSHQSSIGFYKTAETYIGKHGFSLRLDGLEFTNNKARERAIVIHEADYVSEDFIKKYGRLGRSYGCPSLPQENYNTIINKIKNGSCLFIYYPKSNYLSKSKLITSNNVLVANID